jgi:hypothetical protein
MIHVYAVLEANAEVPPFEGIDDEPVAAVAVEGLTAAISVLRQPAEPSGDNLVRHADVVDLLARVNGAVVPARFATTLASREALAAAVGPRAPELRAALARVRGCVELSVLVFRPAAEPAPPVEPRAATGGEYLRRRLAERTTADRLADELTAPLEHHARASVGKRVASPNVVLGRRYLVESGRVDAFRAAVLAVTREHPELSIVCTGPWPPYSFVESGADPQ